MLPEAGRLGRIEHTKRNFSIPVPTNPLKQKYQNYQIQFTTSDTIKWKVTVFGSEKWLSNVKSSPQISVCVDKKKVIYDGTHIVESIKSFHPSFYHNNNHFIAIVYYIHFFILFVCLLALLLLFDK